MRPFHTLTIVLSLGLAPAVLSAQILTVDPAASRVEWRGAKVLGEHHGTVELLSGKLVLENNTLTGGSFAADVTTIAVEDLSGQMAEKLTGHLLSADFFGSADYPTASFLITEVGPAPESGVYDVTGDLTIKGETHPVSFPARVVRDGEGYVATGELTVDRTLYGIRYGSGSFFDDLGDRAIRDEFQLVVRLVARE